MLVVPLCIHGVGRDAAGAGRSSLEEACVMGPRHSGAARLVRRRCLRSDHAVQCAAPPCRRAGWNAPGLWRRVL